MVKTNRVAVSAISVKGTGDATTITTKDGTLQMVTTVTPDNASNKSVTWSVENGTGQATISEAGLLKAVADGTVTVRATAKDGSGVVGTAVITISKQAVAPETFKVTLAGDAVKETDYTISGASDLDAVVDGTELTITATNAIVVNSENVAAGGEKKITITAATTLTINKQVTPPETFKVTLAGDAVKDTDYTISGASDLDSVVDGTELTITATNAIVVNSENVAATGEKKITITAATTITINKQVTPAETYTVTFDSKEGSAVDAITDIAKDATVTLPAAPTKAGFTFGGWFTDDTTFANEFTASTPVTANITVYAKWTAVLNINIGGTTYDLNGTLPSELSWDNDNQVLTMTYYTGTYIHKGTLTDITIKLVGNNTLNAVNQEALSFDNITIQGTEAGTDKLTLETNDNRAVLLRSTGAQMIIENAIVDIKMTKANSSNYLRGVHYGDVIVNGNGEFKVNTTLPKINVQTNPMHAANNIILNGENAKADIYLNGQPGGKSRAFITSYIPYFFSENSGGFENGPYKVKGQWNGSQGSAKGTAIKLTYYVPNNVTGLYNTSEDLPDNSVYMTISGSSIPKSRREAPEVMIFNRRREMPPAQAACSPVRCAA